MQNANIKVCICGGGNIGHSLVAAFGRYGDVGVLTRRPEEWSEHLRFQIADSVCEETTGRVIASSDPSIILEASVIVIALPRFAIKQELAKIEPFLHSGQALVFVPAPAGMEEIVGQMSNKGVEVIGFQRVPFISRIKEYGKLVGMGAVRSVHKIAVSNDSKKDFWTEYFAAQIGGSVEFLFSFLSFTFSNSNPLLHPARLVELLQRESYEKCPLFYAEWGDMASELYLAADKEMQRVFEACNLEAARLDYESVLGHYEVSNLVELTKKIRSIEAFKSIVAPYKKCEDGLWRPDFTSRYFTEDVPFGTSVIQKYARSVEMETPTLDFLVDFLSR
jgi:hypothetical protein